MKFKAFIFIIIVVLTSCEELDYIRRIITHPAKQKENYPVNFQSQLLDRVKEIPPQLLEYLSVEDDIDYKGYKPNTDELLQIKDCISLTPNYFQNQLKKTLLGIYFIENLTESARFEWLVDSSGHRFAVLLFNPLLFKININEWLTYRENTCFLDSGKGQRIQIDTGTNLPGFFGPWINQTALVINLNDLIVPYVNYSTYELSKIQSRNIPPSPFIRGIWKTMYSPNGDYNQSIRTNLSFFGKNAEAGLDLRQAGKIYQLLSRTPFVSIYAWQGWGNDLEDSLLYYWLLKQFNVKVQVKYLGTAGTNETIIQTDNPLVKKHIEFLDKYLY